MSHIGNNGNGETASMEQVRDLLFGNQLKDIDIRFKRQEEQFQREINDVKDAVKKRFETLENFMKSETSSILHRLNTEVSELDSVMKDEFRSWAAELKNEQKERSDALVKMVKDLAAVEGVFERKLAKLAGTLENTEQEVRQLMLTEAGNLSDKVEEKYQDALKAIKETAAQIRHDMVHRSALSALFTETAMKLTGQLPPDGQTIKTGEI